MNLVLLYGAPGVGKLTVARELASLTGYKLFHNHVSIDFVRSVFDFGTEPAARLVEQVRLMVIEEAAIQDINVVFTFVYAHPLDLNYVERIARAVEKYDGRVCLVQLLCETNVLEQRVQAEDRVGKLNSIEGLRNYVNQYDLDTPIPGRETLVIDNTDLPPDDAARRIIAYYGLPLLDGS